MLTLSEITRICQEAIEKLRKNQGCDITFCDVFGGGDAAMLSVYYIKLRFHGTNIKYAAASSMFSTDIPMCDDEEKVLIKGGTLRDMYIIRFAKIIYNYYLGWLNQNGLAAKVSSSIAPDLNVSVDQTVGTLQIGNKTVALSDKYARSAIDDLKDELDKEKKKNILLQDKINYLEAILISKGII